MVSVEQHGELTVVEDAQKLLGDHLEQPAPNRGELCW
jgi:hypothetical protein